MANGGSMAEHPWFEEFTGSIIVCDAQGIILEMNQKARQNYEKEGGSLLIGRCLLDCHSEASRTKLKAMFESQAANIYTIEKKGVHKLIYQVPWYAAGEYRGFIEMSLEIPSEMPHFIRD
jgi:transcriptional regulator with PAS, ATPase and Fis domain